MQTSHFVNKRLHDDDSHDREKDFVLLNFVNFKYHKTLVQQVELLIRIQQIIIFSTTVVWSQYIQKVSEIEILLAVMLLLQYSTELLMDSFFSRSKTLSSVKNGLKAIGRFSL